MDSTTRALLAKTVVETSPLLSYAADRLDALDDEELHRLETGLVAVVEVLSGLDLPQLLRVHVEQIRAAHREDTLRRRGLVAAKPIA